MLLTRLAGPRAATLYLLLASLYFYSWIFPPYLLLLLVSISANFLIGSLLWKKPTPVILAIGIAFNLGLLGWFKYAGFISSNVEHVTGWPIGLNAIVLPLAISFFTFQQIAYLVDVKRGDARPHGFLDYAFFVAFFPQLIAGPIVHHADLVPQLSGTRFVRFFASDLYPGALLFFIGLAKKALIADPLGVVADQLFAATALGVEPSLIEVWGGLLSYSFQIYFDFSAYSDMALGLGRMFGLKLPINFASPYKATSIIEFWRRWNMTLSRFLRDYLYFPLGGSRAGSVMRYANLWIVMLLGGLWHGANWTFVAWGACHALFLTINHAWRRFAPINLPHFLCVAMTFGAVLIAWALFRSPTINEAFSLLTIMAGGGAQPSFSFALIDSPLWVVSLVAVAAMLVWRCPNAPELVASVEDGALSAKKEHALAVITGVLAALSVFQIYSAGVHEFIYFQF